MKRIYDICLLVFCILSPVFSQSTQRIYHIKSTDHVPPKIDGVLDDKVWLTAEKQGEFLQISPNGGAPPSQSTEFMLAYDSKNIYVAIIAYDSEPSKIVDIVTRRDKAGKSDRAVVLFDSFFDKRTAFYFGVNAAGVKMDGVMSEDGEGDDMSWDPVWDVATNKTPHGWLAEMRIPLNQLRYANHTNSTWGLQVGRYNYRYNEWSSWNFRPVSEKGFVSKFGILLGLQNLSKSRQVELLPYMLGKSQFSPEEAGNPFSDGYNGELSAGLDGTVGITSDLTLNFTVNPDFGQVEADPSEVNLSEFESFFREKRPFFIEGSNIFNYTLGLGDDNREALFYSRRLGRKPQFEPDIPNNAYQAIPDNSTILAAAKVTGKTHSGLSVGVLEAVTAAEYANIEQNGQRSTILVEPRTNYFVSRLQKDYADGNTAIGAIFTATNRAINTESLLFLNKAAYTGGIDFRHSWHNRDYEIQFKTAFSRIEGDELAIYEAQTSSRRYYQRPDADYLTLDSTRTTLHGSAGALGIVKGNGHFQGAVFGTWRSPGFEINDIGFLQRADRITQVSWIGYREWRPRGWFREYRININQLNNWNFGGEKLNYSVNINAWAQLVNNWELGAALGREPWELNTTSLRGGPALLQSGGWFGRFFIESDNTRQFRSKFKFKFYNDDNNIAYSRDLSLDIKWVPFRALSLSAEPFFQQQVRDMQYVSTKFFENKARYIFSRISQKTGGVELRIEYSITPELSIQYFGQPFISSGAYSHYKLITNPRAKQYHDRYRSIDHLITHSDATLLIDENNDGNTNYTIDVPDFNFQEFRSNLVLRWEYLPGSTLFLVWSQQRSDSFSRSDFDLQRDLDTLFSIKPDNILLLKLNYWFTL